MGTSELETSSYKILHTMMEPSKVSDYDYDPSRPWRRFITTYVHHLDVLDRITNLPVMRLNFGSDTCASIVSALIGSSISRSPGVISSNKNTKEIDKLYGKSVSSIENIFVEGSRYPSMLVITSMGSMVQLSIVNYSQDIYISLTKKDAENLSNLLDSDELNEMYAISSNDIDERGFNIGDDGYMY